MTPAADRRWLTKPVVVMPLTGHGYSGWALLCDECGVVYPMPDNYGEESNG